MAPQVPMASMKNYQYPESRGYTHLRGRGIDIACIAEPCRAARLSNKQDIDFEQQWKWLEVALSELIYLSKPS